MSLFPAYEFRFTVSVPLAPFTVSKIFYGKLTKFSFYLPRGCVIIKQIQLLKEAGRQVKLWMRLILIVVILLVQPLCPLGADRIAETPHGGLDWQWEAGKMDSRQIAGGAGSLYGIDPGRTREPVNGSDGIFINIKDEMAGSVESNATQDPRKLFARKEDTAQLPPFRFAGKYSVQEIISDPQKAASFEKDYLLQEAEYFAIARNPESMLTYDGYQLDEKTGKPLEPRAWSAPSKECLDLAICIKAVKGDPKAALVVGKGNVEASKRIAADILDKKMDTYMKFNEKYPGYGGLLPWFKSGKEITPTDDWVGRIPGLDNGEWLWTLVTSEKVLRDQGYEKIADKYAAYLDKINDKAVEIFYDKEAGKVRADVTVTDPGSADSKYETASGNGVKYLTGEDAVHEGSMMVMYVTLFGKGLPEDAPARIWDGTKMTRKEHEYGTTWTGCNAAPHESWAHLFMPTREIKEFKDLFRIREEIRTQNAANRRYPGFAAATNPPGGGPGYIDNVGIEGAGLFELKKNDTFAIYGTFPLLLECSDQNGKTGNYGLAWLLNTLKAPAMQGPLGGGESASNDGKAVSYMKTIDGSFPNVVAITGGLQKETADALRQLGKFEQFQKIMLGEYREAFGNEPLKEPCGFAPPSREVPTGHVKEYE
jgi:hypothetical protein